MKTYVKIFLAMLVVSTLLSCEKEDTNPTGTGGTSGIHYALSPPSCLISEMVAPSLPAQVTFKYDAQKRLIQANADLDEDERTEYSYSGYTMTETRYSTGINGTPNIEVIVHNLNFAGLIEKTVEDDRSKGGSLHETFYYYNSGGYLMREINKTTYDASGSSIYYFGMSHEYSGGDRMKSYSLSVNNQGEVTDSLLQLTYSYYMNRTGQIEAWNAWTERTGRGSTHELKEEATPSGSVVKFEYTNGTNGYPVKLKQTYNGSTMDVDISWKCN